MAMQALSQQNAQQLVSELREMGINDDGIYYRLISEGFTPDASSEIMQTAYHKPDVVLQRN